MEKDKFACYTEFYQKVGVLCEADLNEIGFETDNEGRFSIVSLLNMWDKIRLIKLTT
ncbi:MAG: hypothetical protein HN576_06630 [Bacteriovoracaceae bacterium]|jgi:hypothetical protein|nr:hypothetical protein [Bacteriovoracaceae bacterium]